MHIYYLITRTKTSIRYAKENDREKREKEREKKKGRRRDIEREGEIREREVKGIERVKGAQSKPNTSPNAFPKLCEWFSGQFLLKGGGRARFPL